MALRSSQPPDPAVHTMTVAAINAKIREYQADRRAAVEELISHEKRRAAGTPETPPLTDFEQQVRHRAAQQINGLAPPDFLLPVPASREMELRVEIAAIDACIEILGQREMQARAIESVQWERDHLGTWQSECRDWLLTVTRLQAIEARLAELKRSRGMFPLPLDRFVRAQSVLRINWGSDPVSRPRNEAIAAGIVTEAELREAAKP